MHSINSIYTSSKFALLQHIDFIVSFKYKRSITELSLHIPIHSIPKDFNYISFSCDQKIILKNQDTVLIFTSTSMPSILILSI